MPTLNTLTASSPQRVLLYGAPKTGKTLLAGRLAEHFKLIFIDINNGADVLFSLPPAYHSNIDVISIPDARDYPIAAETWPKIQKGPVSLCLAHGKVSCMICKREEIPLYDLDVPHVGLDTIVIWDDGTQLGNSIQAHLVKDEKETYKPGWDEYNAQGALLDAFYSRIRVAPYHTIVICHTIEAETKSKKRQLVPQSGTKNFSATVGGYFNHVVFAEIKNRKHMFASSSTYSNNVLTGSRLGAIMEEATEPSLLPIFKPEMYTTGAVAVPTTPSTSDILARLKSKDLA